MDNLNITIAGGYFGCFYYHLMGSHLLASHLKKELVCIGEPRNRDYFNSIFVNNFINSTELVFNQNAKPDPMHNVCPVRAPMSAAVQSIECDAFTHINSLSKDAIIKTLSAKYKLPWSNDNRPICIHTRLGDVDHNPSFTGLHTHEYIKSLIDEKAFLTSYERSKMTAKGPDTQCPTNPASLDKILTKLTAQFPNKKIYLICTSGSLVKYRELISKYNIVCKSSRWQCGRAIEEEDLWYMMNSDILISSRSSFSIIAMMFFLGHTIYYPYWSLYTCMGLGTKYDKTNFIPYDN